jgi:hypothetical protein
MWNVLLWYMYNNVPCRWAKQIDPCRSAQQANCEKRRVILFGTPCSSNESWDILRLQSYGTSWIFLIFLDPTFILIYLASDVSGSLSDYWNFLLDWSERLEIWLADAVVVFNQAVLTITVSAAAHGHSGVVPFEQNIGSLAYSVHGVSIKRNTCDLP